MLTAKLKQAHNFASNCHGYTPKHKVREFPEGTEVKVLTQFKGCIGDSKEYDSAVVAIRTRHRLYTAFIGRHLLEIESAKTN